MNDPLDAPRGSVEEKWYTNSKRSFSFFGTRRYHRSYEVELVAALDKGGRDISIDRALELVYGYAIGLDMTRRDLRRAMGDQKRPWEIGKSFDQSAPVGPIHPVARVGGRTNQQALGGVRIASRRYYLFEYARER